jgi:two-component system, NarL family, sensor histidine kinase UhpB
VPGSLVGIDAPMRSPTHLSLDTAPLFWRVFAVNAAVLTLAATVLVVSPATISFPVALTELVVLALGFAAMLVLNFVLVRRALAPLDRLSALMRGTDLLRPGVRAPVDDTAPELRAVTRAFNEMVERLETERRESAGRALEAQEGERLRIARDLHDQVGQKLTAVLLQLDRAARDDPSGRVAEAREGVRESMEDARTIARRLRPEALDSLGLVSALAALTNSLQRGSSIRIQRRVESPLPALTVDAELVVYRIAQEALTNVVRHAACREARLDLRRAGRGVRLEVSDDGAGFDPANGEGAGIRGMRERALQAGAPLSVTSAPGAGTKVVVEVPGE